MVFEKARELICEQLPVAEDKISMETSFIDDLNADSLDIVELVLALESEFDMEIDSEDVEGMKTVGDIVNYISEKIQ